MHIVCRVHLTNTLISLLYTNLVSKKILLYKFIYFSDTSSLLVEPKLNLVEF